MVLVLEFEFPRAAVSGGVAYTQKGIVSQIRGLEVQDQGAGGVGSPES